MTRWQLPDHVADVLPPDAWTIERLRRTLLDTARAYGYELVIPPMVEHIESLLTGSGRALSSQILRLVDQLSGRMLGLRADATPQVARIDAHVLGRPGLTRLSYCGPALHTRPQRAHASREPLQFGAEIYGSPDRQADWEILSLALQCLRATRVDALHVELGDARIVRSLLIEAGLTGPKEKAVRTALMAKNAGDLTEICKDLSPQSAQPLHALLNAYGPDASILDTWHRGMALPVGARQALEDLHWFDEQLAAIGIRPIYDLASAGAWGYYTGPLFAVYVAGVGDALLRGGRYDGVGAVFDPAQKGRPAAGFSMDLKRLQAVSGMRSETCAIAAPWVDDKSLQACMDRLRKNGDVVIQLEHGSDMTGLQGEFLFDRQLVRRGEQWVVAVLEPEAVVAQADG